MSEEKQEGQKTIVSFVVGLLIGGLLVWAFSGPDANAPEAKDDDKNAEEMTLDDEADDKDAETAEVEVPVVKLPVGDGKVMVVDQDAGSSVALSSATYPIGEGWIGVRDYNDGQLGGLLGVVRFSESQNLVPTSVILQRNTKAGMNYAVVVYNDNGDRNFSLADDSQLDSVFATFTAK